MKTIRGDWTGGNRAKPAVEYEIRYGRGLLRAESAQLPSFHLVTSPRAHRAAAPYLAAEPADVLHIRGCDFAYLAGAAENLTEKASCVVGLGGGMVLDAAKHVALAKQLPLVQVPAIVSTGAIIHGMFARWDGRRIVGNVEDWPWIDCEYVLVDYDLVLKAPDYLNTAGLGDVLCMYGGFAEWYRNSALGKSPAVDLQAFESTMGFLEQTVNRFIDSLKDGRLTGESIRLISETLKVRDTHAVRRPEFVGSDHRFLHIFELVNDRSWIHGEIVALAALIVSWLCEYNPEMYAGLLRKAKVRYRPREIGVSKDELSKGLSAAPQYFQEKNMDSVLCSEPSGKKTLQGLWNYLENA